MSKKGQHLLLTISKLLLFYLEKTLVAAVARSTGVLRWERVLYFAFTTTSLRSAAFFCVTPSPDRLATPFSPHYQPRWQLPFSCRHHLPIPSPNPLASQYIPPIAIPLPRRLPPPLLLLRWIPGTLSAQIPFAFRSWNASVCAWISAILESYLFLLSPFTPCHYPQCLRWFDLGIQISARKEDWIMFTFLWHLGWSWCLMLAQRW
jgi:hypothetical protein